MRATRYAGLVLIVGLSGCATSASASTNAPVQAASAGPDRVEFAAEVTDVRPGLTDRSAVIVASLPAGGEDCAGDLKVTMQEESEQVVWANVVYSSAGGTTPGACPDHRAAEVTLTAAAPLAGRTLTLNSSSQWTPDGARFRRCSMSLGCYPPADHCARPWIDQAVTGMDVPRHSAISTRACDGSWLVLDIDTGVANCPPREGNPSPCTAPSNANHWFLRFAPAGWQVITGTKRGGCDDVHAKEAAFPATLCAGLPPVS